MNFVKDLEQSWGRGFIGCVPGDTIRNCTAMEATTITASVTFTDNTGATRALLGGSTKRKEKLPIFAVSVYDA